MVRETITLTIKLRHLILVVSVFSLFIHFMGSRRHHCAMGCVAKHYGCKCDKRCSCGKWFDCDDGPSGSGKCTCQYNRWAECNETVPLKPEKIFKPLICTFEIKTSRLLKYIDKDTSRMSRKAYGLIGHVLPTKTGSPVHIILRNKRLSDFLYLTDTQLETFLPCLSGEDLCDGSRPYARGYSGHQFGVFAGQLGDGRAITIGHTADGTMEVSLKGAGRTMFSRFGDGLASLYSISRELLGSVYLHSIGIPVIQSLAVISKEDHYIYRDEWYTGNTDSIPGGVLVRVGESFLRFGSIQHAAKQVGFHAVVHICREALEVISKMEKQTSKELLKAAHGITDKTIKRRCYFIGDKDTETSCAHDYKHQSDADVLSCLLRVVVQRSAALVASWMSIGFAHGVMNTDNMSLIGSTIDLNVYGFVTGYNNSFTPNFVDTDSRYAFGQQKDIMYWNLQRVADALTGTTFYGDREGNRDTWMLASNEWLDASHAREILQNFHSEYNYCFQKRMEHRLGLRYSNFNEDSKKNFVRDLINSLTLDGINYHYFSRHVADINGKDVKTGGLRRSLKLLKSSITDKRMWKEHIHRIVPSYVFDNNQIASLLKRENFSAKHLQTVLEKFYNPFIHETNSEMYSRERVVQTSCGGQ